MKAYLYIILFQIVALKSIAQLDSASFQLEKNILPTDSVMLSFFSSFNFNLFIGKPIDSMLNAIPFPVEEIVFINSLRHRLRASIVYFSDKIGIDIEVHKYQFIVARNPNRDYVPSLFRRETLEGILLLYDEQKVKMAPLE
jgi:hypothetical protein